MGTLSVNEGSSSPYVWLSGVTDNFRYGAASIEAVPGAPSLRGSTVRKQRRYPTLGQSCASPEWPSPELSSAFASVQVISPASTFFFRYKNWAMGFPHAPEVTSVAKGALPSPDDPVRVRVTRFEFGLTLFWPVFWPEEMRSISSARCLRTNTDHSLHRRSSY